MSAWWVWLALGLAIASPGLGYVAAPVWDRTRHRWIEVGRLANPAPLPIEPRIGRTKASKAADYAEVRRLRPDWREGQKVPRLDSGRHHQEAA